MERNAYALATGVFVVVLGIGLLLAARWLQGPAVDRQPYQLISKASVAGLAPHSKVYYRGVDVGQVTAIQFAPDGSRDILIDIVLEPRVPVTGNTYGVLKSQGLTGLSLVELLDDGPLDAPHLATSAAAPARIPMRPSLLESFQAVGQGIAEQIQQLSSNANRLFTPDNIDRMSRIMANLEHISVRVDELLIATRPTLDRLPPMLAQGDTALAEAGATLRALRDTLELFQQRLGEAGAIAARTEATVQGIGAKVATSTLPELEASVAAVAAAAKRFEQLAATLERDPPALLLGTVPAPPGPGEPGYHPD
ncbi:MAG: MCE family protein [Gammaproteobacteria bacterium]|nr:MCE family protein [Gammaproteobacteria bacterium]